MRYTGKQYINLIYFLDAHIKSIKPMSKYRQTGRETQNSQIRQTTIRLEIGALPTLMHRKGGKWA
jgi:hypothetical protein